MALPDHFTFIMLGYMAFAALGVGNPIMHYTGSAWAMRAMQETGTLERNLLAPAPREALILALECTMPRSIYSMLPACSTVNSGRATSACISGSPGRLMR